MKTKVICIALAALAACCVANAQGWGNKRVKESKNYVTKEIKVDDFTKIQLLGSPTVYFTQKPGKPEVKVYTSDNIAEVLDIHEEGGTLYVGFKKGYSVSYSKLDINVSSETLDAVHITGSGEVYIKKGLTTDDLSLHIAGSGDIAGNDIRCSRLETEVAGSGDLVLTGVACTAVEASVAGSGDLTLRQLATTTVEASVAGSGDLTLNGKGEEASYHVAGSGDIHAAGMVVGRVEASVAGSGDIKCHATDYLKARVNGSGDIGYKGHPKEVDIPRRNIYEL